MSKYKASNNKSEPSQSRRPESLMAAMVDGGDGYELQTVYDSPNRPVATLIYKSPSGATAQCATLFRGKGFGYNVKPEVEEREDEYRRYIPLADAVEMVNDRKGFLNFYLIVPRDR